MAKRKTEYAPLPKGAGGFVFPSTSNTGMELLDWYAGMALAGILARGPANPQQAAESSILFAEAMIRKRV